MDLITAALVRTVGYRTRDFCHPRLAVYSVSLAEGTVIANGLSDDLGQAIGEIFVVQQFTGGGARAGRSRYLADQNRQIHQCQRQTENHQ